MTNMEELGSRIDARETKLTAMTKRAVGEVSDSEHVDTVMTQNKKRRMVKKVVEEAYKTDLKNAQAAEENKSKDLPAGMRWSFICHKTGKKHVIESHMIEDESGQRQSVESEVEIEREEDGSVIVTGIKKPFVKKKHYFFYSPSGYGKTLMLARVFSKMCNVTTANDLNNFTGVRSDAQFIVIDDYGPDKRLSMEALKSLTSGDPENSFAGKCKSHGTFFVPRNDVQVVILSNYHLFYCMGKGPERKISSVDAKALRDRFHIIKMHEGVDDDSTEEEEAHSCYIEYTPMERNERFKAWL